MESIREPEGINTDMVRTPENLKQKTWTWENIGEPIGTNMDMVSTPKNLTKLTWTWGEHRRTCWSHNGDGAISYNKC